MLTKQFLCVIYALYLKMEICYRIKTVLEKQKPKSPKSVLASVIELR